MYLTYLNLTPILKPNFNPSANLKNKTLSNCCLSIFQFTDNSDGESNVFGLLAACLFFYELLS